MAEDNNRRIIFNRIKSKFSRPNHTPARFINACLNFLSKSLKSGYVFGLPEHIVIELTNLCDLKCPLCPIGSGKTDRKNGFLSLENFKKIIDEVGDFIYFVALTNYGEPFLNKDIFEMISYAKRKKLTVTIMTNAQKIDSLYAPLIVGAGPDAIVISMDGASQSSYEKYKIGGSFYKVIEAVELIQREKAKRKSPLPSITLQSVITKHNEHEMDDIISLAARLEADRLIFKKVCDLRGFPVTFSDIETYMPGNPAYRAYKIEGGSVKWNTDREDINFCDMAWNYPAITWDGALYPCCFDYSSLNMGNVFKTDFKKAWNSKRFVAFRSKMRKNKYLMHGCSNCGINFYDTIVKEIPVPKIESKSPIYKG